MSAQADQLNQLLPPALRPGPSRAMGTEIDRLLDGGWTIPQIHAALMPTMGPNAGPGVVIYQLRNMPDTPPAPVTEKRTPETYTPHTPCPDGHTGQHGQPCQLCWCDPNAGPVHHVRTDPWIGWPNLDLMPADYGPGWLRPTEQTGGYTPPPW